MTLLNNTQGLTGQALLDRVAELQGIEVEDMLRATGWFQGYGKQGNPLGAKALYQALIEAKQEAVAHCKDPQVVHQNVSRIGILGYRWLVYQYDLDNGFKDAQLAEQQHEFFADLETSAKELRHGLGYSEAGMVISDVVGVMTQLIAYIRTNRWTPDNVPTDEERRKNFDKTLKWANDTKLVKRLLEIGNNGFTEDEVKEYNEFRWDHHSQIANYIRTVTLDYSADTRHQDVPAFAEGLQRVKAFLSMLDENSEWTTKGLFYIMISAVQFDWRCEKDRKETIEFAQELLYRWVEEGHAIRAEHLK